MTKVTFDTADFVRGHGHEPRGTGAWAFSQIPPSDPAYLNHTLWIRGDYATAKREVAKIARERGITLLYVCA